MLSAQAAGPSQHHTRSGSEPPPPHHTKGTPPRHPSPPPYAAASRSSSTALYPSSPTSQGHLQPAGHSPERPSSFTHALSQAPASSPYRLRKQSLAQTDSVQLTLEVSEASSSIQAILSPTTSMQPGFAYNSASSDGEARSSTSGPAAAAASESQPDESAALGRHEQVQEAVNEDASQSGVTSVEAGPGDAAELQTLLTEERKKTAALISEWLHCCWLMSSAYCCSWRPLCLTDACLISLQLLSTLNTSHCTLHNLVSHISLHFLP